MPIGATTVTVGDKGKSVSPGLVGNNGGASSFGSILSSPGGRGGSIAGPTTPPWNTGNIPSGSPSGANLISASGSAGGISVGLSTGASFGELGGASYFGGGGGAVSAGVAGSNAASPGAGGGGTANVSSAAAQYSGEGAIGLVIVEEYS